MLVFIIIFVLPIFHLTACTGPNVRTYKGRNLHMEVEEFLSIPYARVEHRFSKSVLVDPPTSERVLPASMPNACTQKTNGRFNNVQLPMDDMWTPKTPISEDCLYLNIWRPFSTKTGPKKVLLFIHGGMFISGSSSLAVYNGSVLARAAHALVVTINYRLNAFGFLYFGVPEAPGNMGLWDQVRALEWVHKYIHLFGGDGRRITVIGKDAGAVSANMHILSDKSRWLVRRAVILGGSVYNWWGVRSTTTMLSRSKELAGKLGCLRENNSSTVLCMRAKSASAILEKAMEVQGDGFMDFTWAPVYGDDFFPLSPKESLRTQQYHRDIFVVSNIDDLLYYMVHFDRKLLIKGKKVPTEDEVTRQFIFNKNILKTVKKLTDEIDYGSGYMYNAAEEYFARDTSISRFEELAVERHYAQSHLNKMLYTRHFHCDQTSFTEEYMRRFPAAKVIRISARLRPSIHIVPAQEIYAKYGTELYFLFGIPLFPHEALRMYGFENNFTSAERDIAEDFIQYLKHFAESGYVILHAKIHRATARRRASHFYTERLDKQVQ